MSNLIEKAIDFATRFHDGQKRKGTDQPYIVHPIAVGEILKQMTDDEEIISAGYLHDTIEDCEGITKEVLEKEFTSRVAWIVDCESEDKSKAWIERKKETIEELKDAKHEIKMVALADKLSNIRDIKRDYEKLGEDFWNRFAIKDKEMIGFYYKGIKDSLSTSFKKDKHYIEYCHLVNDVFG
jgi:myo-inositol-1(or 4)-monophosphatase